VPGGGGASQPAESKELACNAMAERAPEREMFLNICYRLFSTRCKKNNSILIKSSFFS